MKPEKSPYETPEQFTQRMDEYFQDLSERAKEFTNHVVAACVGITAGFLALLIFW